MQLEKPDFYLHGRLVMHEKGIDRKPMNRRFQNTIFTQAQIQDFATRALNSIQHKIRKSRILTFSVLMRIPYFGVS
jgi:hypothetical protein